MKGIILAGGSGSRLRPLTKVVSKQLLPVYDKPMIYYPLSTLLMAGIKDILIITTVDDAPLFEHLFGNGSLLGCNISYVQQPRPEGLAQAFILGKDFIAQDSVCLILGDNIFYGGNLLQQLNNISTIKGGLIFAAEVARPQEYGVLCFDQQNRVTAIEEKPSNPKSNFAVPGLYFYDNTVVDLVTDLKQSDRGEYEITDLNRLYLKKKQLKVCKLTSDTVWLDMGSFDTLIQASQFVKSTQERYGVKLGCIEEIAFNKGYIDKATLLQSYQKVKNSIYGEYLQSLINK